MDYLKILCSLANDCTKKDFATDQSNAKSLFTTNQTRCHLHYDTTVIQNKGVGHNAWK